MNRLQKVLDWFLEEWLAVFVFGTFFALVFQDVKLLGWFVAGAILNKAFRS